MLRKQGIKSKVPIEVFDYNRWYNPDGFGIAWREPNEGLKYEKFAPGKEPYEAFEKLSFSLLARNIETVVHFRKATQGPPCESLSHPYEYRDQNGETVLVFHNGIIDVNAEKWESDTEVFTRDILAKLPHRWWNHEGIKTLVESKIGWSRIILMTSKETVMLNASEWTTKKGIWYSTEPIPKYNYSGKGYEVYESAKGSAVGTVIPLQAVKSNADDFFVDTNGHLLYKRSEYGDREVGIYGGVECDECQTKGQYYSYPGDDPFFDIDHQFLS